MRMHNYTKDQYDRLVEYVPQDPKEIDWRRYNHDSYWKAEVYFVHCDTTRIVPIAWLEVGSMYRNEFRSWKKSEEYLCFYKPNTAVDKNPHKIIKHSRKFNSTGPQKYTVNILKIFAVKSELF